MTSPVPMYNMDKKVASYKSPKHASGFDERKGGPTMGILFSRGNQQSFLHEGSHQGVPLGSGSGTYLGRLFAFASKFTGIEETMTAPCSNTKRAVKTLRNTAMLEIKTLL
ncbi:hypothetical protein PGT21_013844 [Puccinia graminis f. sp. tritici]|uniref:Uncharacterized protein n=1 Tax=Puccinia graminis f. sp. tritici TaxID=56615 RepID=A0A5B0NZ16_PUCGR|nr:hypothetical protein PGTUg99_024984 [Puccinia graminis f. sp. tritici]KAA1094223.1 hypothetical protein PGT21_013844 [Puccinia graminis f. sp. tritici]